jgi:hypothetical protein
MRFIAPFSPEIINIYGNDERRRESETGETYGYLCLSMYAGHSGSYLVARCPQQD